MKPFSSVITSVILA